MISAVGTLLRHRWHPGQCSICGPTAFLIEGPWLRDDYRCARCGSIPRQRALIRVLDLHAPDWRRKRIFESSPSGPGSALLARECADYTPSQFFDDVPSGTYVDGVRREDLRELSLEDESVDLVVTQDVLEHIVGPTPAFVEISRVLRPGGLHVFTVPIYTRPETLVRVADDGRELMEPDFHGNPVGDGRSLVVREWGRDLPLVIDAAGPTSTVIHDLTSWRWGLRGKMKDVGVTKRS